MSAVLSLPVEAPGEPAGTLRPGMTVRWKSGRYPVGALRGGTARAAITAHPRAPEPTGTSRRRLGARTAPGGIVVAPGGIVVGRGYRVRERPASAHRHTAGVPGAAPDRASRSIRLRW